MGILAVLAHMYLNRSLICTDFDFPINEIDTSVQFPQRKAYLSAIP